MDNQDKKVFSWIVKQGNLVIFAENDKIHFEINKENNPTCLLTRSDAQEVISILSEISQTIWTNPEYIKEPYKGKIYQLDENGKAYWDINETRLFMGNNDDQEALELDFSGNPVMKIPVNISVEMIQVMDHFLGEL